MQQPNETTRTRRGDKYKKKQPYAPQAGQQEAKRRKKKLVWLIVLCSVAVVALSVVGIGYWKLSSIMGKLNDGMGAGGGNVLGGLISGIIGAGNPSKTHPPVDYVDDVEKIVADKNVYNILLLGLDTRDPKDLTGARSDVMIIVTLDGKNNAIKLTSIMRDTLVSIPGHDKNRINTANVFGGVDLAREVVESNFGVDIHWTACVNFWTVAKIIDVVGGVDIELTAGEVTQLNDALKEVNQYSDDGESADVKSPGLQHLDGKQAVAYMRIRHTTGGDFKRTERQRTVLEKTFGAVKHMTLTEMLQFVEIIPDYARTDMTPADLVTVAKSVYGLRNAPMKQLRLPIDGGYKNASYKNMSILEINFKANNEALAAFMQE